MNDQASRSFAKYLACLFLLCLVGVGQAVGQPYDLAIANVTVIDGTGGPAHPGATVYVRDGRIAAIAKGADGAAAAKVIDGTGKYLIPGLFDAHAHPFPIEENFPRFVHYGVTSILITGCSDCTNENLARARALGEDDAMASPRVFHTSQHFTMEGRHPVKTYPSPKWVEGETVFFMREPGDAAGYVEKVAQQPIVGIKVTIEDGPTPPRVEMIPVELVAAIVEAAHARDLKVFAHVSSIEGVRTADAAGADHLLHFVGVDIDWERDREVIERLRKRSPSWVTTLMIDKRFFYPTRPDWIEEVRASGVFDSDEITGLLDKRPAEEWIDMLRRIYGVDEPTLDSVIEPQVEDLRELQARGFNLVVGSDTTNDFILPGLSVHEEMELLARGFEPAQILRMATRNAAEMLGVLDDQGTLEVGKRADMVLLDRNPLEDIRHTRSIRAVFKDGREQARIETATPDPCAEDSPTASVAAHAGLELAEGEQFETMVAFDEMLENWWPEGGLKLLPHHSAAIKWSNLESFEAFGDRTARVEVSFRVQSAQTNFYEHQHRWATTYTCEILEAQRLPKCDEP
jgi:imidazolonepropionase-like amidohydrolase